METDLLLHHMGGRVIFSSRLTEVEKLTLNGGASTPWIEPLDRIKRGNQAELAFQLSLPPNDGSSFVTSCLRLPPQ